MGVKYLVRSEQTTKMDAISVAKNIRPAPIFRWDTSGLALTFEDTFFTMRRNALMIKFFLDFHLAGWLAGFKSMSSLSIYT